MLRRFDQLGRIVIPKEWRDELEFKEGSVVDINKVGNKIIIQSYDETCIICGSKADLTIKDKKFCRECYNYIRNF